MNHTDVFFLPFWEHNPYHTRLRRGLRKFDVRISQGLVLPRLEEAPQVIHLHTFRRSLQIHNQRLAKSRSDAFIVQLDALIQAGSALVVTLHDLHGNLGYHLQLDKALTAAVLARAHRVIYHSPSAIKRATDAVGEGLRQRAVEIPHPHYINAYPDFERTEARAELGFSDNETVFLALGAMRQSKGLEELVSSFISWHPKQEVRLLIAGATRFNTPLEVIEAAAAQDHRIHHHPSYIPDERLACYLRAADCAVLPYREVTTSGAMVLAMSFGLPVVAPDRWCFQDLLDTQGAVLYPPDEAGALQVALMASLQLRGEFENMGLHNQKKVRQSASPSMVAEETWRAYEQAMSAV